MIPAETRALATMSLWVLGVVLIGDVVNSGVLGRQAAVTEPRVLINLGVGILAIVAGSWLRPGDEGVPARTDSSDAK